MAEAMAGVSSVELEPPAVGVHVEPVELSTTLELPEACVAVVLEDAPLEGIAEELAEALEDDDEAVEVEAGK